MRTTGPITASEIASTEPIADATAVRITHDAVRPELVDFITALKMQRPVSIELAAQLLEHLVKEQMATDAGALADQMRSDHWDAQLSEGEQLAEVAERALTYLATEEGIRLFNFFVKTFARTSGDMFE